MPLPRWLKFAQIVSPGLPLIYSPSSVTSAIDIPIGIKTVANFSLRSGRWLVLAKASAYVFLDQPISLSPPGVLNPNPVIDNLIRRVEMLERRAEELGEGDLRLRVVGSEGNVTKSDESYASAPDALPTSMMTILPFEVDVSARFEVNVGIQGANRRASFKHIAVVAIREP